MENVYAYPMNDLINIRNQFVLYKNQLSKDNSPTNEDEDIKTKINFSGTDQEFNDIVESVSLEKHLESPDDLLVLSFNSKNSEKYKRPSLLDVPKAALNLNTVKETMKFKAMQKGKQGRYGSPFGKTRHIYKLAAQPIDELQQQQLDNTENLAKPGEDVIISIRFYRPFRYTTGIQSSGPIFSEEFLVLGSQFLTELRDKITCTSNNRRFYDISSNPNQEIATDDIDSSFFFITDTFYNDTRNKNNSNYSQVIIDWAKKQKESFPTPFQKAKMESTKFFDLNIRLGYPQVYQHHGNCEHLFTFSSIQILSVGDDLMINRYPILNTVTLPMVTMCDMCGSSEYNYLVHGSNRQMHDPCHLCSECFENYHYIDGKKIGNFKAYRFNPKDNEGEEDVEDNDETICIDI